MTSLFEKLKNFRIILASGSLRRRQLLKELGIDFEVAVKSFDESFPDGFSGEQTAEYIAVSKAKTFVNDIKDNDLIITADTIVCLNGKILGKPGDKADAIQMLQELSGNTHEVITGVSVLYGGTITSFTDTSKVTFRKLSDEEIVYYVETYNPCDKAGAYGIQEWIGLAACTRIEGSFYNIMGLPVQKLYDKLCSIAAP
ncbi:MAG: Maf family nucleotide pyrophosphatase [Bacteroidales bacterium]|jgi:septum formation protein|nr:Maf family nucleotide pyrophosphatase [Bacteroidales bacterium]